MVRWVALLCLAACTPTAGVGGSSASSGADSETSSETSSGDEELSAAVSTQQEAETANALDEPPPPIVAAGTTAATAASSQEADPPSQQVASVRPTMILAPARSGRLRLPDVHEVIRAHRPEVTRCYEAGLARDRSLAGEAKVRFLIGPQGRIEDAEVYESSLRDPAVEACILAAMREWSFPRPRPRGSSVLLTYPYSLSTE